MGDEFENLERVGGYVSKIFFNNGKFVDIKESDIVILVGPNNAGKSQMLRDINTLCYEERDYTKVVKKIELHKYTGDLEKYLKNISTEKHTNGIHSYAGFNYNLPASLIKVIERNNYYLESSSVFVAYLDTMSRLSICSPAKNIIRNKSKEHPIHYAAFDSKYRKWLSESFKKAFGKELTPNTQYGSDIPLCIGDSVVLKGDYPDEQTRLEAYAEILEKYDQIQNQGDGMKSFVGILLYLMLDNYSTFLIDEPEAFLHAPQAKIMGQIIGEVLSNNQQAFIATHSEEIIKGLLEVCPDRIKVIRITRNENENCFSILENDTFSDIWNDSLLKHSNIMASLFHKKVVLCESDSDCKFYSIIESYLKQKRGEYSESLFIHCGGKHRMAKIASALISLNINIKLICDIDVLDDINIFKGISTSFGIDWRDIEKNYHIFVSNLHSEKEFVNRNDVRTTINRILDSSNDKNLSSENIKEISQAIKLISKWVPIKTNGIVAIPSGDATKAYNDLNNRLKLNNIFVVPVGELECFVKEVGGHGSEWVNNVLEEYPDLENSVYDQIKNFLKELDL